MATSGCSTRWLATLPGRVHDVEPARRQPALVDQQRASFERGQRRGRRRLQHDRAAGGDGRGDLVAHQVEREVERARSRPTTPIGHPLDEAHLALAGRAGVEGDQSRRPGAGHGGREAERVDGAGRLDPGGLDRLGRLGRDATGRTPPGAPAGDGGPVEDGGPLVGRQGACAMPFGGIATAASRCSAVPGRTAPTTAPS